jgi:hypothetical protein
VGNKEENGIRWLTGEPNYLIPHQFAATSNSLMIREKKDSLTGRVRGICGGLSINTVNASLFLFLSVL